MTRALLKAAAVLVAILLFLGLAVVLHAFTD